MAYDNSLRYGGWQLRWRREASQSDALGHQPQVRALEGMPGRPLFRRVERRVVPTEDALTYSASIGESFARLMTATNRVGKLSIDVVAHRLVYRRADETNPEIMALVEWLTRTMADRSNPASSRLAVSVAS